MSIYEEIAASERSQGTIWLNSKEGKHVLKLKKFSTEMLPRAGQKMVAKLEVVSGEGFPSGTIVSHTFDVYNNTPDYRKGAIKMVKTFLCEFLSVPDVGPKQIEAVEAGDHDGGLINSVGIMKAPREKKDGSGMTKPFVEVYFNRAGNETPAEPVTSMLASLKK